MASNRSSKYIILIYINNMQIDFRPVTAYDSTKMFFEKLGCAGGKYER